MGWLSFLFSSDSSRHSRRGQAMSTTDEAFSLHSSPPIFQTHPDAFNPDALSTPDPESATGPSYTYPPQGSGKYGYVPTNTRSRSIPTSLLPLHHDAVHSPLPSSPNYPPLARTWNRIQDWLSREIPELGDTLNYGIPSQDLAQIEMQFGFALPPAVRESYLVVDGQEPESAAGCSEGLFFGLTLLPLEDVYEEWRFWREVDDDVTTGANPRLQSAMQSFPPGWIRREYSQRGWIPLVADKTGNYLGVDLNPGEGGSVGQVIVFGRDFDTKVVLWKGDGRDGWGKWLASFAEELENGETYEIGGGNEPSDGSEDGVGYDSYFNDGHGRGQGEGGSDSAFGGLRLVGEYRGWSTLEAWADRSLRKWYEVGAIPPHSVESPEEKQTNPNFTMDVMDFDNQKSVAESSITVVDKAESIQSPSLDITNQANQPPPQVVPTNKIPVPLPVEVPTADDIIPPISREFSYNDDLESGHGIGMREVSYHRDAALVSSKLTPQQSPTRMSNEFSPTVVPLPSSPTVNTPVELPQATISSSAAHEVHDFLEDSDPPLDVSSIEPTSSLSSEPVKLEPIPIVGASLPSEQVSKPLVDGVDPEEHDQGADMTVRLIGGGGTAGTAQPIKHPQEDRLGEGDIDLFKAPSVDSSSPPDVNPKDEKKQEKRRSGLSGLKRLGNLGGLRKKDSRGSVKEMN